MERHAGVRSEPVPGVAIADAPDVPVESPIGLDCGVGAASRHGPVVAVQAFAEQELRSGSDRQEPRDVLFHGPRGVVQRRDGPRSSRPRPAVVVGHHEELFDIGDQRPDEDVRCTRRRGIDEDGAGEPGPHGAVETADEGCVGILNRGRHRLEVEARAVSRTTRHEVQRLADEPALGSGAVEECRHPGEAATIEQLERRHDSHAGGMGGIGHRRGVIGEVGGVAAACRVEAAVGLDA